MTPVLQAKDMSLNFGALRAVDNLSFQLHPGERHALIGPNGAGKTSFVNLLSGIISPSSGEILLDGKLITHMRQHERVKHGITRTFQITTLFPGLTALETLILVICERDGRAGQMRQTVSQQTDAIRESLTLLSSFHLESDRNVVTRNLPYGKQRLLEIAVALATRPRVLLLDEPAAGVPINESAQVLKVVANLPKTVAVLLIEHDMELVFQFAERISVMVMGSILMQGPPQVVAADRRVREVYLGEADRGLSVGT
ncbi:MAG: ABC transporter ATP-binding protein [Xanthobacteraceae bacterium]